MKDIHLLTAALVALAANCFAATITVDGTGLREMLKAGSTDPVPAGSDILVGYFTGLTDAQIISNQHNPTFLESKFISFGLGGAIGQGVGGAAGYFTSVTTAMVEAPGATFTLPSAPNNNQIYVWIFDSNISAANATQQAIFTSSAANWSWPVTDDGSTDRMVSPDDNLSMLIGTADSSSVHLAAMPEPASCGLLVMGLAGLLGMRRVEKRPHPARG